MSNRFAAAALVAVAFAGALVFSAGQARAQEQPAPAMLLVLDKDAIDYGPAPHLLPEDAVNADIAGVGVRDELRYFQSHVDAQVVLPGGMNGSDGWFALRTVPANWSSEEGAADGLENFALAGPGLGSPDDDGNRESLLGSVPDVRPILADGFAMLVGKTVCAVVYNGDVASGGQTTSLEGPTLGRIAFKVVSLASTDDAQHPNVQVQIVEGHEVCGGAIAAFSEAP